MALDPSNGSNLEQLALNGLMLQIFDAVIVLTSFALDLVLVFVDDITAEQSESAIALLIIFLLWRILRIVNGSTYSPVEL